jgi:dihydroorotase
MDRPACAPGIPADLLIAGARVVDPGSGLDGAALDVRIHQGVIAEVGPELPRTEIETIDAGGLVLLPGLVDPHVHLRTPGDEDEENIGSGTRAAAAGGFTAILAMPNTRPVVDTPVVLAGLVESAGREAVVPTGFMAAITAGQEGARLAEMVALAGAGAAAFSDDGRPVEQAAVLRRAFQYASVTGLRLALHEEDLSLSGGADMHEGAVSAELGLRGYPSIGESVMVGRDLAIARYEGAPVHVCHVSAAESVAEIRRARELGVEVTAEVTPHHLCLTDEHVRSLDASRARMSPPLRGATDRAALIEALADGTLDCIGTDHAPHRDHEKEQPFAQAPNGVIGLETAFPAVYTHLVEPGLVPLAAIVERMSVGPAAAFGLPRPAVREGEPANLSLWNLNESWLVEPPYASRSANCAFAGQTLRARCHLTVAAGTVAHRLIEAVA